jgi:hypothetical protein
MQALDLGTVSSGPLSYSEERAWRELHADRATFFKRGSLLALQLDDAIDQGRLRDLVDTVTRHHEILRTAYEAGQRRVLPFYQHEIRIADKPAYPVDGLHEAHVMPEDLVRIWLTPGPDGGRTLYFDLNEMITDMGSSARLSTEIGRILGSEPGPLLAPPAATYAQFAAEQRREALPDATLAFWERALDGARPDGSIPDEGPDPSGDTAGESVLVLPDEGTAGFRAFCQRHRVSSFTAVVALVGMALAAMWDLDDLTLATAASTRPARYRDVLGNYSNNVLLRSRLLPGTTLTDAARAARTTVIGALRHPAQLRKIAEDVAGVDEPPIRVHYLAANTHYYKLLDAKPSGASWKEPAEFPGWPLEVGFAEDSRKRVAVWVQYDPRRFRHARIEELLYCLRTLIVEAAATGGERADAAWLKEKLQGHTTLYSWQDRPLPAAP